MLDRREDLWRMAKFRYVAKDMGGKTYRGTTEATSEAALIQQLREQELFLVESKNLTKVKGYKKLKAKQLAAFCRELSTLLSGRTDEIQSGNLSGSGCGDDREDRGCGRKHHDSPD